MRATFPTAWFVRHFLLFFLFLFNKIVVIFQSYDSFLEDNAVRIRDIELLTGFRFLTTSDDADDNEVRLRAIRMRTRITNVLW